jgi:type II secretory pathway pseudopilin PulG
MIESQRDSNMPAARPAFSLIELVAALALATLLTIAVLAGMRSIVAGRDWLVREQTALDVLSTRGTWSELVAEGAQVPMITPVPVVPIIPPDNSGSTQAIVDKTPFVFQRLGMKPMPEAVRIVVARQDATAVAFAMFLR